MHRREPSGIQFKENFFFLITISCHFLVYSMDFSRKKCAMCVVICVSAQNVQDTASKTQGKLQGSIMIYKKWATT